MLRYVSRETYTWMPCCSEKLSKALFCYQIYFVTTNGPVFWFVLALSFYKFLFKILISVEGIIWLHCADIFSVHHHISPKMKMFICLTFSSVKVWKFLVCIVLFSSAGMFIRIYFTADQIRIFLFLYCSKIEAIIVQCPIDVPVFVGNIIGWQCFYLFHYILKGTVSRDGFGF